MTELSVYLFGPPRVECDGVEVEIGRRKAVAILAYVAISGSPQSRATLATLFWPDDAADQARAALRRDLAALTTALPRGVLHADRETVGLAYAQPPGLAPNPGDSPPNPSIWVDVADFHSRLAACRAHGHAAQEICPRCIAPLGEAVQLYRGDFLAGFSLRNSPDFDEWQRNQGESLALDLAGALERLVQAYAAQGEYAPAIPYARRWVALDPLHEAAHRALMQLFAWSDQPAAALRQYQACADVLAAELGVPPSSETGELYQSLKEPQARRPRPSTLSPDLPLAWPAFLAEGTRPDPEEAPFVAREQELAALDQFLQAALAGQGRMAFVSGEAGSGKTALLRAFARRAQAAHPDLVVATGVCQAFTGAGDPYLPFREILGSLSGDVEAQWAAGSLDRGQALALWELAPATLQALVDEGPALVDLMLSGVLLLRRAERVAPTGARWLPGLRKLVEQQATGQSGQALGQRALVEQATRVLLALTRRRPLLLILDDLQWADEGSLTLLRSLGRRLASSRLCVVGAYRPHDMQAEGHPLHQVVQGLQRALGNIHIDLDRAAAQAFVQAYLDVTPHRLSQAFQDALLRHTQGHALFTVETLRAMQGRGDILRDPQGYWVEGPSLDWETLPAQVEGMIGERLGGLPSAARAALEVASVEGELFTAEALARVLDTAELPLIRQLRQLDSQDRLVRLQQTRQVGGQRLSVYRFGHHLFQKYLYRRLDSAERAYLHEAVGHALEALYGDQPGEIAVRLAHHFEAAGRAAQAIRYLRMAGDGAARVYAHAEAAGHYRRSLALAREHESTGREPIPHEVLAHLFAQLGRMLELESRWQEAVDTYAEMASWAAEQGDRGLLLAARMAQILPYAIPTSLSDPAHACALGEQALALAHELENPTAEVTILRYLTMAALFNAQVSRAVEYAERGLALGRTLNSPEALALVLMDAGGFGYMNVGRFQEAKALLEKAVGLWRQLDNLPMLANALSWLSRLCSFLGEYAEAITAGQEALALSIRLDNVWGQAFAQHSLAQVYWDQGDPDQALAIIQESIRLGELAGFAVPQVDCRLGWATIYDGLGMPGRGLELVEQASRLATAKLAFFTGYAFTTWAQLLLRQNRLAEAQTLLQQAQQDVFLQAHRAISVWSEVEVTEAELALRQGDAARALALTAQVIPSLRQIGLRPKLLRALYLQGQAWLAHDQTDAARACWREARAEADAIGSRWMLWQILAALAALDPDPGQAEALRQRAREMLKTIGQHISDPELRASFYDLPAVRNLFAANDR
jgi:DNA-binding SARP family transcriptional activator